MKAALDHTEDIARNITTFWFKPESEISFMAGQYLRWHLPHENADERGERRWFTISASPTEAPLVSITTKFAADDGSSFKKALRRLKPGDTMEFTSPLGDFVLPKDSSRPLVFIAGGIGVTPFRSIAKFLSDSHEKRQIQLIYAVTKPEEIAFKELFEQVYSPFTIVLGEPSNDWQGETGRLNGQRILDMAGGIDNKLFYFSGPEPMVEAFVKECKDLGLKDEQIVLDYFPGYREI